MILLTGMETLREIPFKSDPSIFFLTFGLSFATLHRGVYATYQIPFSMCIMSHKEPITCPDAIVPRRVPL